MKAARRHRQRLNRATAARAVNDAAEDVPTIPTEVAMPLCRQFQIGFLVTQSADEHLFLSVTEGFEHGPGIQRDGISKPRMTDPHSVPAVLNSRHLDGRQ